MRKVTSSWPVLTTCLALAVGGPAFAQDSAKESDEVEKPISVVEAAVATIETQMAKPPAERVPLMLRHAAKCVAVFPQVLKAGIIVAGKRGQGLVSCREEASGEWGAPAYYNMTEASIGLQAGVQSASILLLVVDDKGVERLMSEKITFGGDVSVAAGPLGAAKQVNIDSSVVSYVRTEGVFAGVQLGGSALTYDKATNAKLYGTELPPEGVLFWDRAVPEELKPFQEVLMRYAPPSS